MNTPKAFANFSPGFELARTLGTTIKGVLTLKGFANRLTLSGLVRYENYFSQGSRKLEPWAEISERLRRNLVNFKLMQYHLSRRLDELEKTYDQRFRVVFNAIRMYGSRAYELDSVIVCT